MGSGNSVNAKKTTAFEKTGYAINTIGTTGKEDIIYAGYYKNGVKHGRGLLYSKDFCINGVWEEGKLRGYCTATFCKHHYDGTMTEQATQCQMDFIWLKDGFGRITTDEGMIFNGFFGKDQFVFGCEMLVQSKSIIKYLFGERSMDTCINGAMLSWNENNFWKFKEFKDGKTIEVKEMKGGSTLLEPMMRDSPAKDIYRMLSFEDEPVANLISEEMSHKINSLYTFDNMFELIKGIKLQIAKALYYSSGRYHFSLLSDDGYEFHAKGYLCYSAVDCFMASWSKRVREIVGKFYTGDLLYVENSEYQDFMDNPIYEIKHGCVSSKSDVKYGFKLCQSNPISSFAPKMYLEIDELLTEKYFLHLYAVREECKIMDITNAYSTLISYLKMLESCGIYHGCIRPRHIWFNPNSMMLRIIDFSEAHIPHKGLSLSKHNALNCQDNIEMYHQANILSYRDSIHLFDIEPSKPNEYQYLTADERQEYTRKSSKALFSLFKRDAMGFGMSFINSIISYLSIHPKPTMEDEVRVVKLRRVGSLHAMLCTHIDPINSPEYSTHLLWVTIGKLVLSFIKDFKEIAEIQNCVDLLMVASVLICDISSESFERVLCILESILLKPDHEQVALIEKDIYLKKLLNTTNGFTSFSKACTYTEEKISYIKSIFPPSIRKNMANPRSFAM